ncbi:hypothetical protein BBO99_00002829 [Phytophthora kernoviae]|uniref:Uncharacterized protein n=2 Tax=Phytophthora kernoviae TaxID=325452 RepID=A0A3R7KLZ3_9STRA|nr:hypothetical protein G195_004444 [Phytophthora kernoviae 00238/432]KAG2526320.1 hypothetical protein JM16_003918 [Phytophthora kernoviae]KAG2527906.1 hypothetical protein JM18_003450 [Phytophthora kernoviae]RLN05801.1 hypothetical protein BBI17_003009 [Phytophthora kernoviae]RLN82551.1 hypothetical protein BBO99_00002829 [Phytophthora kernoviae]
MTRPSLRSKYTTAVGRKSFMIIATQVLKIIIILTTLFTIKERDQMKRKTGDEFIIGIVLWICEYTSIVLELSLESLKEKSKYGIKYFLRNFAELTLAQMVSAQLFDINQNIMLYLAIWESFVLSVYIACKCGRTSPYWLLWVGIAVGFVQGLILQRAQFNSSEEVVNYIFLFVLTLNLPIVKNAYEKLEIPPEYKYSYHKSLEPNADTDQNKPANSTESTNAQLQPVDAV